MCNRWKDMYVSKKDHENCNGTQKQKQKTKPQKQKNLIFHHENFAYVNVT